MSPNAPRQVRTKKVLKRSPAWYALAMAAMLGLGGTAAPAQTLQGSVGISNKEYVQPTKAKRDKRKKQQVSSGGKPQKWRFDKNGNALDGRGDYRSEKSLRREFLTNLLALKPSGRQWVKARKDLRGTAPDLLVAHPAKLRAGWKVAQALRAVS